MEINKNKFVNVNHIVRLELVKNHYAGQDVGFCWELTLSNGETIGTKVFKTEEQAMTWFLQLLAVSQG